MVEHAGTWDHDDDANPTRGKEEGNHPGMGWVEITMQSRTESLVEQILNIGSGFFVSLALWTWVVVPIWKLPVNTSENLQITLLFTVVSIARSYVWRRAFNAKLLRQLRKNKNGTQPRQGEETPT